MLTRQAEQIFETAVVHTPRVRIESQMIRFASTVANSIAIESLAVGRCSIGVLERKVDAYIHAMIDWRSVRAPTSMEMDHLNQSVGAVLPGSTAAIGSAESEL